METSIFISKKRRKTKIDIDKICFWAMTIDIFFLPYFTLVSVSYSIPIIVLWYICRGRLVHKGWEYRYYLIVLTIMIISTIVSIFYTGEVKWVTSFSTSVKRFIQFTTSIWYYMFFKYYFIKVKININKVIAIAILVIGISALIYNVNPQIYALIKNTIHPADTHTIRALANEVVYRFNFLWSDPNNVAYVTVGLLSFYWIEETNEQIIRYILLLISVFVLFSTMSNGGLIALVIVIIFYLFNKCLKNKITFYKKDIFKILFYLCLTVFVLFIFQNQIESFLNSSIISNYKSRLEFYVLNGDITGGRFSDMSKALKLMSPMFFVLGCGLEGFTSEIGHLYLIAMYGLIVYFYFMIIMFGKRKNISLYKYIVFIPFFIGFTLNIAIIEQKFLLILLFLSAYYAAENYRLSINKTD